ncbi:peptide ABC transporter permease [Actinomycetales bacterium SN12]|nr:peptide ABC transporter permease [Actinomycetales bacterium SN12]
MTIAEHPAGRLYVPGATATTEPLTPTVTVMPRAVTWSKVDTGFYVASKAGEYVGSVDTTPDGHFVAFDATSAPIGRYTELSTAKSAVLSWKPERARMRDRRVGRIVHPIAASAGLVAGVTAAFGALLTVFPA